MTVDEAIDCANPKHQEAADEICFPCKVLVAEVKRLRARLEAAQKVVALVKSNQLGNDGTCPDCAAWGEDNGTVEHKKWCNVKRVLAAYDALEAKR